MYKKLCNLFLSDSVFSWNLVNGKTFLVCSSPSDVSIDLSALEDAVYTTVDTYIHYSITEITNYLRRSRESVDAWFITYYTIPSCIGEIEISIKSTNNRRITPFILAIGCNICYLCSTLSEYLIAFCKYKESTIVSIIKVFCSLSCWILFGLRVTLTSYIINYCRILAYECEFFVVFIYANG